MKSELLLCPTLSQELTAVLTWVDNGDGTRTKSFNPSQELTAVLTIGFFRSL